MVSLPMAAEGKVLGALNVYSREPDAFSAEAVSIGELIAGQAGIATQVASSFFRPPRSRGAAADGHAVPGGHRAGQGRPDGVSALQIGRAHV